MSQLPNVVVVLARCAGTRQPFGIRFEEKGSGQWIGDWAFVLQEASAKREGYDRSSIAGTFGFAGTYPGCPSCRVRSFFKCSCGKVSCWNGEQRTVTCAWCSCTVELSDSIASLSVGGDR